MANIRWILGIGVLCLLGMVLVFFNRGKSPVNMPSQVSGKYSSITSIEHNELKEVISPSETHRLRKKFASVIYTKQPDIEISEPLAIGISDNSPISIGEFIDDDDDSLIVETDKSPINRGEFIDDDSLIVETDKPPISIGEFIDDDDESLIVETDKPSISIGEFIDDDSLIVETDKPPISIGEYLAIEP